MYFAHNHTDLLRKFDEACKWFTSIGFDYSRTRYKFYEKKLKDLDNFVANEKKVLELTNAYLEVIELLKIYNNLKHTNIDTWSRQAEFLFKGQEFAASKDQSRDFLFELLIASKFVYAREYKIELNTASDIKLKKGSDTIYVECKRVKSRKSLIKNIKVAAIQIDKKVETIHDFGLIFVDITEAVNVRHLSSGTNHGNTMKLMKMVNNFLNEYFRLEYEKMLKLDILNNVYGIFFYCRCFGIVTTSPNQGFMYVSSTKIFPLNEKLKKIVPKLFNQNL